MHNGVRVIIHSTLGLADQRRGGSISLPAALTAAGALLAVYHNHHVAALATGAVDTVDDLAVQNDAAAHAGAQGHSHKILRPVAATGKRLTQCGAVGVILYKYIVNPQALPKHFPGRHIVKGQVVGKLDHAVCIAGTGRAHTHGHQVTHGELGLPHGLAAHLLHIVKNGVGRARRIRLGFCSRDNIILIVHHGGNNIRAPQVNS